jgi:glycerate 2-kinase
MADLTRLARQIFQETLAAIDIPAAMQRKLHRVGPVLQCDTLAVDLRAFKKVRVVAIGKAAHAMLKGLQALLPEQTEIAGVLCAPTPPHRAEKGVRYFAGGHPIPNAQSLEAAAAILGLLQECDAGTLVFFLLSGGGSALVELPLDTQMGLAEVQHLYRVLVTCGASITEINAVRKHVSAVKGGQLAAAAGAATKITIAVSDVPVGHESALASGPTVPDPTTIADVERIVAKYHLAEKFPEALRRWVAKGEMPETPKPGDAAFVNAHFLLLLGMDDLFHPAHHAAEAKGFIACCDNATDDWPVEKAAEYLLQQLQAQRAAHPGRHVAVIADGEVSSPVTGSGVGGRNAAFVLACVENIVGQRVAVLSAGTDGIDGNSRAAGAVADGATLGRALGMGLHPARAFQESDSYTFFAELEDTIVTGPTGNNLRDLRILLAEP